jgi:hypothetical protein
MNILASFGVGDGKKNYFKARNGGNISKISNGSILGFL